MEHYILASHGSLAYGMKTAVEMICGKNDDIESYDLDHFDCPEDIYHIVNQKLQENSKDTYIIFTDLLGGSVQNYLLSLGRYDNTVIITGMHLGLVLAIITGDSSDPLQKRADDAINATIPMISAFTKEKINANLRFGEEDEI